MNTIKTLLSNLTRSEQLSSDRDRKLDKSLCNYANDYYGDQRCQARSDSARENVKAD